MSRRRGREDARDVLGAVGRGAGRAAARDEKGGLGQGGRVQNGAPGHQRGGRRAAEGGGGEGELVRREVTARRVTLSQPAA